MGVVIRGASDSIALWIFSHVGNYWVTREFIIGNGGTLGG
jgi:hypothetical protein